MVCGMARIAASAMASNCATTTLFRSRFGLNPAAESGLSQRVAVARHDGAFGLLRAATLAQQGFSLLRSGIRSGFVFTVERPAYFRKFRNFN